MNSFVSLGSLALIALSHAGCTETNGADSTKVNEKIVMLRDGYNGYSGTRDTSIYVAGSDWTASSIGGSAGTAEQAISGINTALTANIFRTFGLISFDVSSVADELIRAGDTCADNIEVAKAELELFALTGAVGSYVTVTPLLGTAPAWDETATYTMANATAAWPTTGSNPNQPVLDATRLGYFDAIDGLPNGGIGRHFSFRIPTDSVKDWICDSSLNRGMLWRFSSGSSGFSKFFTREFPDLTFRPLLTIYLRRVD